MKNSLGDEYLEPPVCVKKYFDKFYEREVVMLSDTPRTIMRIFVAIKKLKKKNGGLLGKSANSVCGSRLTKTSWLEFYLA